MKILWGHKDGGPDSNVRCWGLEIKGLCSILVLHFAPGSREAFHSHAFNAVSWLIAGDLCEDVQEFLTLPNTGHNAHHLYSRHWRPVITRRATFHKVSGGAYGAWVLTLRGRWHKTWVDGQPGEADTLTHGRKKLNVTALAAMPKCPECGFKVAHALECSHAPWGPGSKP